MSTRYSTKYNIDVVSDIALEGDQPDRIVSMVYGQLRFDHEKKYLTPGEQPNERELTCIHFKSGNDPEIPNGATSILMLDGTTFETSPFIFLEDKDGNLNGWKDCAEIVGSEWMYGIMLEDRKGQVWIYGRNNVNGDPLGKDEMLVQVSPEASEFVTTENGPIRDNLPAEGEFMISKEDVPVVTSIPWWGGYGPEEGNIDMKAETIQHQEEMIAHIHEKIAARDLTLLEP